MPKMTAPTIVLTFLLTGCGGSDRSSERNTARREVWQKHCGVCHAESPTFSKKQLHAPHLPLVEVAKRYKFRADGRLGKNHYEDRLENAAAVRRAQARGELPPFPDETIPDTASLLMLKNYLEDIKENGL